MSWCCFGDDYCRECRPEMFDTQPLAVSTLVYWCKNDQWHLPLSEGSECPNMECLNETIRADGQRATKMRKRRGWVCAERECDSILFGTKTYAMSYYKENHVHNEFD